MEYTYYDWDVAKERRNLRKHGISFAAATRLFEHPHIVRWDARDEYGEDRWIAVGLIGLTLAVVVFVEDVGDHGDREVRIISARKATGRERKMYEQETGH